MTEVPQSRPGVLVDRDGTLIRDTGYLTRLEQIEVLPGVPEALQLLRQQGLTVAVITNQSAVARGLISEQDLAQIHRELKRRLACYGAFFDAIYYCPHHPTEGRDPYRVFCGCRKPKIGLAERAAAELQLELGRSYVVGDQSSDMELAATIGAKGFLLRDKQFDGGVASAGYRVVKDLLEAAQIIVEDIQPNR